MIGFKEVGVLGVVVKEGTVNEGADTGVAVTGGAVFLVVSVVFP